MKGVVAYEPMYGNTAAIGEATSAKLRSKCPQNHLEAGSDSPELQE